MKSPLVVLGILIVTLVSCKTGSHYTTNKFMDTYTVDLGEEFMVNLRSDLCNGYSWQWVNKPDNVVDSVTWRYITLNTNLTNVGGTEKWEFKAIKSGEDSIKLRYFAWEDQAAIDSIYIVIRVK
nr:protease inhibitor I42 family protein [uncultured Carboxylicivirga sp.]